MGDESHIFQYEADGVSVLGGVGMHTVPTADNGELPLAALNKAVRWASHQDAMMRCRTAFASTLWNMLGCGDYLPLWGAPQARGAWAVHGLLLSMRAGRSSQLSDGS